ncbi:MAG: hypothetical protein RIS35_2953 [Pseudomonadota bacterium]|jgi:hypothetical protein
MPRSAKPRKAYRPRLVNAPVTDGLMQQFEEVLVAAEIGLNLRAPTDEHFEAIAKAVNVVGPVALRKLSKRDPDAIALTSAALAMNAAADRARTGNARMYDSELLAVGRGIDACKRALPRLAVRDLYVQLAAVDRMRREMT